MRKSAPGRTPTRPRRHVCDRRRASSGRRINRDQLAAVQAAAREANQLIDRRAFSWTDLFNRFEETLPGDVRIAAVPPQVDPQGRMLVAVTVISRRVEDLDGFIEALEKTRRVPGRAVPAGGGAGGRHVAVRHPGLLPPRRSGRPQADGPRRQRPRRPAPSASPGARRRRADEGAVRRWREAVPLSRVVRDYRRWLVAAGHRVWRSTSPC